MAGCNALNIDALDYLIPPVKKAHGSFKTELLFSRNFQRKTDVRLIKDVRKKITRGIIFPSVSHPPDLQDSASVILKKTTEELISEKYSLLHTNKKNSKTPRKPPKTIKCFPADKHRNNNVIDDKPTIKVTIIPREAETQTKVFNKRSERTKLLQNTVSNQENSVESKNIYFMVKGKRREKVYEIKSSESTNFSNKLFNTKYEDISLQQVTNSKRLINSLNMEKKKRKNRKADISNTALNMFDGTSPNVTNLAESKGVNPHKSKVTIVGQLGLTRDDQYILKCAATVDDKPIETNYMNLKTTKNKDFSNVNSNTEPMNSQGTQVNINQPIKDYRNKTVQCSCSVPTTKNSILNIGKQDYVIKNGKNPLVVISVYPKNVNEDNNNPVTKIDQPSILRKKVDTTLKGKKAQQKNDRVVPVNAALQRSLRSRSPSPAAKTVPNKILADKTIERDLNKNNNKSKNIISQSQKKNKSSHKLNNTKDVSCSCPYSKDVGKQELLNREVSPKIDDIKGADTKQVKQALVNHFLRSVDKLDVNDAKVKKLVPKNPSRVTINIDGENEYYDLLIEQNYFDTGLAVRKTVKKPSQILRTVGTESLLTSDEMKNATSSKTRDIPKARPIQPRLNIRDSLEISHSREDRGYTHPHTNQFKSKADTLKTDSFNSDMRAPVKHFRGDECPILDPNERDKEIRALLGIVRNPMKDEYNSTKDLKVSHSNPENQKEKADCSCYVQCSKSLVNGINVSSSAIICTKGMQDTNQRISNVADKRNNARSTEKKGNQAQQKALSKQKVQNHCCIEQEEIFEEEVEEIFNKDKLNATGQGHNFTTNDLLSEFYHNDSLKNQNPELNSNLKLYLHIGKHTKQKPVILTRKQYEKVKKAIQCSKYHRCNLSNYNVVSVGEIKIKQRLQNTHYDREVQTERSEINRVVTCKQVQCNFKIERTNKQYNPDRKKSIPDKINIEKNILTTVTTNDNNVNNVVIESKNKLHAVTRQTVSSMAVIYTNASRKGAAISSTCFGDGPHNEISHKTPKNSPSLFTIFKGHRKCISPNLGTSVYSLYSEENESSAYSDANQPCADDSKPTKPFFRRLLSCLVMRTPETTGFNKAQKKKVSHVNSSVDAYHISTSLGAMEMTSSLYDTSASFYSNHLTVPTNKMKRGFFSSVWGILSIRRS